MLFGTKDCYFCEEAVALNFSEPENILIKMQYPLLKIE